MRNNFVIWSAPLADHYYRITCGVYNLHRPREWSSASWIYIFSGVNLSYKAWSRQQNALVSTGTQVKQSSCILNKITSLNGKLLKLVIYNLKPAHWPMGRVFTNCPGDLGSIPGRVILKTLKMVLNTSLLMVLNTSLLNTQQYKVLSRVKWRNPGIRVAPFPTPQWSSNRKGSLLVALDYGRQLYLLTYPSGNISSTESDVDSRISKVRAAIHRLSTIWKCYLFDKLKREFV